jgi:6-phosphogluconolactonase (cycloisomerase 2 family)
MHTVRRLLLFGLVVTTWIIVMSLAAGCGGGNSSGNGTGGTGGNGQTGTPATPLSPAEFVYIANVSDNTVSRFQVYSDGTLRSLNTVAIGASTNPAYITVNPTGRFLYVTEIGAGKIAQFKINTDGSLTPLTPATVAAGSKGTELLILANANDRQAGPGPVVLDSTGKFAFVPNNTDGTLLGYTVNADGTLTPRGTLTNIQAIGILAADSKAAFLYAASDSDSGAMLSQFRVNADGTVTALNPASLALPTDPGNFSVDPQGRFLFGALSDTSLPASWHINADGTLTQISLPATNDNGAASVSPLVDPSGRFLYSPSLLGEASFGQILQFRLNADGSLTPLNPPGIHAGTFLLALNIDPSGQFVYAIDTINSVVSGFQIGTDGTLSAVPTPVVATGNVPTGIGSAGPARTVARSRSVISTGYRGMAFVRR